MNSSFAAPKSSSPRTAPAAAPATWCRPARCCAAGAAPPPGAPSTPMVDASAAVMSACVVAVAGQGAADGGDAGHLAAPVGRARLTSDPNLAP